MKQKMRASPERVGVGMEGKQSQVGTTAVGNGEWEKGVLPAPVQGCQVG